jgi:integral membrane protein TerC family protein
MSLDNVLAVAGAAREHPVVLLFGLTLSIALMGLAASFIARVLQRRRWIAYIGLAVICGGKTGSLKAVSIFSFRLFWLSLTGKT